MIVLPARPEMVGMIDVQPAQRDQVMHADDVAAAIDRGPAYAVAHEGRLLAIGGVAIVWPGRGHLWGLLAGGLGVSMTPIHRVVSRVLAEVDVRRLEAHISCDHPEASRWIEMLGFEQEGVMRAFWKGRDFALYARVR